MKKTKIILLILVIIIIILFFLPAGGAQRIKCENNNLLTPGDGSMICLGFLFNKSCESRGNCYDCRGNCYGLNVFLPAVGHNPFDPILRKINYLMGRDFVEGGNSKY